MCRLVCVSELELFVYGKRVGKIVGFLMESVRMIASYEAKVTELLQWIQIKVAKHSDHTFPNSLDAIKSLQLTFNKE